MSEKLNSGDIGRVLLPQMGTSFGVHRTTPVLPVASRSQEGDAPKWQFGTAFPQATASYSRYSRRPNTNIPCPAATATYCFPSTE